MKPTNFLSIGPYGDTDIFSGGFSGGGSTGGVSVNVPQGTSPDYISMIMNNLPGILGIFGGGQQAPPPPRQDMTPYYIIGAAALVFLITSRK